MRGKNGNGEYVPGRGPSTNDFPTCRCPDCTPRRGKPRTTEERMARALREQAARRAFKAKAWEEGEKP